MIRGFITAMAALALPGAVIAHGPEEVEEMPDAVVASWVTQAPEISGLTVMVSEGAPPALWMRYEGEQTLTVLDRHDKPMLRFDGERVMANPDSHIWNGQAQMKARKGKGWQEVSGSEGYGWHDPRLDADNADRTPWSVTVTDADGNRRRIHGVSVEKKLSQR